MRRWNGWGDDANNYPMPAGGEVFLEARLGPGRVLHVFAYLPSDWSMRAWKNWPISSAPRLSRAASCAAAWVRLEARR